jgi:hypothetical protein
MVWEKWGYVTHNMTICKLMINKHENICDVVYWSVGVPGESYLGK